MVFTHSRFASVRDRCYSYYSQEASSDESVSDLDRHVPAPAIGDASPHTDTLQEVASSSSSLPASGSTSSPSSPTSSQAPSAQESATAVSAQQPSKSASPGASLDALATPKQSKEMETKDSIKWPLQDAKSLAVAIGDQDMMSRSDLEERLLRNLYAPVQSLQSEVRSGIGVG